MTVGKCSSLLQGCQTDSRRVDGGMTRDNRKQDQQARAAWMYYVAGQTQDDIARALAVSRQTAQRLVA